MVSWPRLASWCAVVWRSLLPALRVSVELDLADDSTFINLMSGSFLLWFGSFVGLQTMKTRAVFNAESFELKTVTNKVLGLQASVNACDECFASGTLYHGNIHVSGTSLSTSFVSDYSVTKA